MSNNKYAPILVSVYHRIDTLKKCITALKENLEACNSDLYVVSDGAGRSQDVAKVDEVREYVRKISGFKSVTLIAWPTNFGANRSISEGIKQVLRQHSMTVFLEDDILVSKYFLKYMNDALRVYHDDARVFAICGYKCFRVPRRYNCDVFELPRYSPWGIGLWADKYFAADLSSYDRYGRLQQVNPKLFAELMNTDPMYLEILKRDSCGLIKATDARIEFHIMQAGLVCIYPRQTMTRSMDSGADAMHCQVNWCVDEELAWSPLNVFHGDLPVASKEMYDLYLKAKYPGLLRRAVSAISNYGIAWTVGYYLKRLLKRRRDNGNGLSVTQA